MFLIVAFVSSVSSVAFADSVADAKALTTKYFGKLQVDLNNAGSVQIETLIPRQQVELIINSAYLSTTSFPILFGPASLSAMSAKVATLATCLTADPSCLNPSLRPTAFSKFAMFLNGCNISAEVVRLCAALPSGCSIPNAVTTGTSPHLGNSVTMTSAITLNKISMANLPNVAACTALNVFSDDAKYSIQFNELDSTAIAGGTVNYDIAIQNQTYNGSN